MKKDKEKEECVNAPEEMIAETDTALQEGMPSREEKFEALIRGEYKDLFDKAVEDAVKTSRSDVRDIEKKAAKKYEKWLGEARETREKYSSFDLSRELKNSQFCELLKSGVPMKSAFELIHRDELMKIYAKELEENITKRILAGTLRPKEAAIAPNSSTVIKSDPSKMSKHARQNIIKRVQSGEKICF